jgi:glycosyltransferase involved in cell wall biosynthesis
VAGLSLIGPDIVIATQWRTAHAWLASGAPAAGFASAYFVQDFEPDFYPALLPERRRALESYALVPNRIATSRWLQGRLADAGFESVRVPLGVNLGIFHPRALGGDGSLPFGVAHPAPGGAARPFTVTAIARPDPEEARRGFAELVRACEIVHGADPSIRIALFGCPPEALPRRLPFAAEVLGPLRDPERVARHLASCDVVVDPSRQQAFGRPGLEAMACGVATVLPRDGGIDEYARDGENTLSFRGGDARSMADAILALRRDQALRTRLARAGLETARRFDHREEGRRHLALYRAWIAARSEEQQRGRAPGGPLRAHSAT